MLYYAKFRQNTSKFRKIRPDSSHQIHWDDLHAEGNLSAYIYNQASTKLAFHSNETSKDGLSTIKLAVYYCYPGACQTTQKLAHFHLLITRKHYKVHFVVEKLVKNGYGEKHSFIEFFICCRCTLNLPQWGNSNLHQQHMLLKLRKHVLKYTLNKYHVHWLCLFQTSQTANQYYDTCHYIASCLYLHDSYITQFDFMNYAFAKLLLARLCVNFVSLLFVGFFYTLYIFFFNFWDK